MTDGPLSVAQVRPDSQQRADARAAQGRVDTREAPGVIDTIVAGFSSARADTTGVVEADQVDAYKPLIEALIELEPGASFTRYVNPATGTVSPQSVWRDIERYRKQGRFKELPATVQEFEQQWRAKRKAEIEAAEDVAARGNGVAAFTGGVVGAMTDPVNLYTLPVGGAGKTVAQRIITEGLVNMGIEAAMLPTAQRNREALGRRDLTLEEAGLNIALAGVGGAAIRGGFELAPGAARVVGENIIDPIRRVINPDAEAKAMAQAFEQMVPANLRTPEQEAALFVMRRSGEVDDVNPYVRTHEGIDAHVAKMDAALQALEEGRIAAPEDLTSAASPIPPASPITRPVAGGGYDLASVKAAIAGPESAGDPKARNRMGSSASGLYQFIEETFKGLYKRVYGGGDAAADRAWQTSRDDLTIQNRLMDQLVADNAAALQRAGLPADPGNLYLAHFAGAGKAVELLRAPRDAPVSSFFSAKAIRQNPGYLGGGKTVGEAIDIIRGKVGDPDQASPAPIDPRLLEPELRNPALDAERPATPLIDEKAADIGLPEPVQLLIDPLRDIVTGTKTSLNRMGDLATELGTDEATLREALTALVERGDITQNTATGKFMRKSKPPVTAANTKRSRTLIEWIAENGGANDFGGELRAAGIAVNDKRFGKKVIRATERKQATGGPSGEGDQGLDTLFRDAREAGYFPELDGRLEDTYADLVDGPALLLQAINEEMGGSPRYRMDDWDRLPEYKLTGSTEGIYGGRIASLNDEDIGDPIAQLVDSFREAWEEFGGDPAALAEFDGDFLFRAADFYDRGDAFLPEHALAMVATEDYERALAAAIREGLADEYSTFDPWNPEWDAEFDRRFAAARARDRADGNPLAGQEGVSFDEAIGGARGEQPQGGEPPVRPSPAELDAAAAAKPRSDHTDLPPDPDPRFDEPDGLGIVAAAESAWHDIRLAGQADPKLLYHGTRGDRQAENPNGLGMTFFGEQARIAQRYAEGAGGRRAAEGEPRIETRPAPPPAAILDITTRQGLEVLASLEPQGRIAKIIVNDAKKDLSDILQEGPRIGLRANTSFYGFTKSISANDAAGFRADISDALAARGYEAIRFNDDQHVTVGVFDRSPDVDPNIAVRQAQEAQLGAEAPMRANTDQDGTMGLGLFDAVDQKSLFDLGDGRGERSVADIRAELDADKAAIDTLRSCMT